MPRALLLLLLAFVAGFAGAQVEWTARSEGGATVVTAKIGKDWHLYSTAPIKNGPSPTQFRRDGKPIKATEITKATTEFDKNFGIPTSYFAKSAEFRLPGTGGKLEVNYQVCNARVCIPPKTVTIASSADAPRSYGGDASTRVASAERAGILPFLALAFGFGLLSLLTPCVFPMIPITVSYFSKRRDAGGSSLAPALAFCLGIVGTYTIFGVLITALLGAGSVRAFGANPWVNLALGLLFVYLSLNLFGVFEIRLPGADRAASGERRGLLGPVAMGFAFTITSFTCAVGFVGAVLAAAATGKVVYPALGMLAFSTAFASPFFLLALFPSLLTRLPRSGAWMETVKATMGFVELMAAAKFLSNVDLVRNVEPWVPRGMFLAIWATIATVGALWLFGALRLPTLTEAKIGPLRRGFGLLFAVGAGLLFLAVPGRGLGPMEAFLPPMPANSPAAIPTVPDYARALQRAKAEGKRVLINFTGVTCTNCRLMERYILPSPEVKRALEAYVVSELYTDRQLASDRANKALQMKLAGSEALPLYMVVDPDGTILRKFEGSTNDPAEFARFLRGV